MIGLVSESLKNLLEAKMTPAGTKVTLLSPIDTSSQQKRVNLFLYRVIPNPHLYNQDFLPKPGTLNGLLHPPLALNLFYLLTPFAPLDPEDGQANAQGLMAEAMRVLYENPILPQTALVSGLQPGQIKVTLHSADVEELSKIWTALEKDLQLSATYEVSFAEITPQRERTMPKRVEETSVVVVATNRRPAISAVDPRSGTAGTTIRVSGENLRGWKVTARVGGRVALRDEALFENSVFDFAVPFLAPGVYELEISVSGLTEFRGAFEVTP